MIKVIIHSIVILVFVFIGGPKIVLAEEGCHKEILYEDFSGAKSPPITLEGPISQEKANTLPVYWKGIYDCKGKLVIIVHYINSDIDPDKIDKEGRINQETKVGPEALSIQVFIYEGDDVAEIIRMDANGKVIRAGKTRKK